MLIDFARCFGPEVVIALPDKARMVIHNTSAHKDDDGMSKRWKRVGWSLKRQLNQLLNERDVGFWNAQEKTKESKTKGVKKSPEAV